METGNPPPVKKGIGALGWTGIGCGGLVFIVILGLALFMVLNKDKLKQFGEDAQKNPTRATANAMVTMTLGKFEMVASDDVNLRYTVKEKASGKLFTIYWDAAKKAPITIEGDFSKVPPDANPTTKGDIAPEKQ